MDSMDSKLSEPSKKFKHRAVENSIMNYKKVRFLLLGDFETGN